MVKLYFAHTSPINPPSATPVLTHAQVWAGLQRKIRFAQEFVPVIESCNVLSDTDGVVTRDVKFKKGAMPHDELVREVVKSYGDAWVDFVQKDGSVIKNIVSDSGEGGKENLHMSYAFEMDFPKLEEGSKEAEEQLKKSKGTARMAVDKSIETIRQMVIDGRIAV